MSEKDTRINIQGFYSAINILLLMIDKVTDQTVTLNANHPLAGKALTFEIVMLDVNTDPPKEMPPMFAAALGATGKPH